MSTMVKLSFFQADIGRAQARAQLLCARAFAVGLADDGEEKEKLLAEIKCQETELKKM